MKKTMGAKSLYLTTADSHRIHLRHLKKKDSKAVIILAHGFFTHKDVPLFKTMEKMFHDYFSVIGFDFRGHGASSGRFSWTSLEPFDLQAVISFAGQQGYEKIGVIGFSLGAAVALIEASRRQNVSSLIAVSAPYSFWKIDCRFWEKEMFNDLKFNMSPGGRGKTIRPGHPFLPKVKPIDAVARIPSIPTLFIHGAMDWLIKPHHSKKLFEKALPPKGLVIMPKAGHAEMIFEKYPKKFEHLCIEWFEKTLK